MSLTLKDVLEHKMLTPQQEKLWSDTRSALMWHAPAFSHIFYSLLQNNNQKSADGKPYGAIFCDHPEIPIAATDGWNLVFNTGPEGFFRLNLNMRVFVVAHEIMHNILGHCEQGAMLKMRGKISYPDGKSLDYDADEMNMAQDYVINAILSEGKIGQMPQDASGKQLGLLDPAIATSADNAMDTYRKIHKKQKQGGGSGQQPGKGSGNFDTHLAPGSTMGKNPQQATSERNQAQWDTEIQSAMSAAKAMGKLPAGLERALGALLEPKVDWREKIRALFARKVGSGTFDWRRPDRRLITRDIYAPGRSGFGAGCVVVGVDTSGSIGPRELDMFMAEMAGILEDVRPQRLVIMWCDAEIGRVDEAEEASDLLTIRKKGAPGGGGTSFIPVFDRIAKEGLSPEALVYLTDGMGSFPNKAPSYPVIWGNIYPASKYPWGDVVDIPKQA
jgi:predicted metal-dependent peptidase